MQSCRDQSSLQPVIKQVGTIKATSKHTTRVICTFPGCGRGFKNSHAAAIHKAKAHRAASTSNKAKPLKATPARVESKHTCSSKRAAMPETASPVHIQTGQSIAHYHIAQFRVFNMAPKILI